MAHPLIPLLLILSLSLSLSHSQIVNGCARYYTNSFLETKCILCSGGMVLSASNTCESCPSGQTYEGGGCTGSSANTNMNSYTQAGSVSVSSTNAGTKISINSFNTIKSTNTVPVTVTTDASSTQQSGGASTSNDKTTVLFNSFTQNNQIFTNSAGANPTQQATTDPALPPNCQEYSKTQKKCVVCFQGYQLDGSGTCAIKIQQNNKIINTAQSYDPTAKASSTQPQQQVSIWATDSFGTLPADEFSSFGNEGTSTQSDSSASISTENSQPIAPKQENSQVGSPPPAIDTKANIPSASNNSNSNTNSNVNTKVNDAVVHKFPQYPYCFDYDSGQCWACVSGFLLNLVINKCVPYVKPAAPNLAPSESTKNEAATSTKTKSSPSDNCNIFLEDAGVCQECLRNYFLNKDTQLCENVDPLCRTYDKDTGECLTCYAKYELKTGKCVKV